jgi:hypothetical protein
MARPPQVAVAEKGVDAASRTPGIKGKHANAANKTELATMIGTRRISW